MDKISTVAELLVKISGNNSGLRKELAASKRQLSRFQSDMPDLVPAGTGAALTGIGAAMAVLGIKSVKMASDMETNSLAFETMLGSGEKAKTMLDSLASFAEKTPFEFDDLVNSSKKMLGLGVAADQVLPQLQTIGDAVAAVGGTSESVDSITNAFAKMQAAGFIGAEQMNRLTDAGIPGWQLLAKTLSDTAGTVVTVGDAMKMAENKSINATTAIQGMLANMNTNYGGAMTKMSDTTTGIFSNIKDTATNVMRSIGEQLNTSLQVKDGLKVVLADLTTFKASVQAVGVGQAIIDLIPAGAFGTAIAGIATAITLTAIPAIANLSIAIAALGLAAGPVAWAVAGIAALAGYAAYLTIKGQQTSTALINLQGSVRGTSSTMATASAEAGNLADKLDGVGYSAMMARREMRLLENKRPLTTVNPDYESKGKMASASVRSRNEYAPILEQQMAADKAQKELEEALRKSSSLFSGGGGEGGGVSGGMSEAGQAMKDLQNQSEQLHKSIQSDWVSTTKSQLEQLDIQESAEIAELDKVKDVSSTYEEDSVNLAATYAAKRLKITQEETKAKEDSLQRIAKLQQSIDQYGLSGSAKTEQDIRNAGAARIEELKESKMSEEQKAENTLKIEKQTQYELNKYALDGRKFRENLDTAKNAGNIQAYIAELNSERGALAQNLSEKQTLIDDFNTNWVESHKSAAAQMEEITQDSKSSFKTLFSDILTGAETLGDALGNFFASVWSNIVNSFAQKWAASITNGILTSMLGIKDTGTSSGDAVNAKNIAAGAATAVAWAPAAAMVSLATFGANSAPAIAGISAANLVSLALAGISGKKEGGDISGPGTGTSDSILSWLSDGEYVIKASAVKALGIDALNTLNTGQMPAFATGGLVTGPSLSSISGRYSSANTSSAVSKAGKADSGQPVIHNHYHQTVNTMDAKSFTGFMDSTGGKVMRKWMKSSISSFAT